MAFACHNIQYSGFMFTGGGFEGKRSPCERLHTTCSFVQYLAGRQSSLVGYLF